jgi:hypothetical protein
MSDDRHFPGDMLGLPIPADADTLRRDGAALLTRAFHAFGALGADNRVTAITRAEEWHGGGTGSKLLLSVAYAEAGAGLPTELFVKFSRNFDDPIRDGTRHHMEPEVRLAALSRVPGFPIAVPTCVYADFHRESGTGILVTERIPYGANGIEPHYPKCLDQRLPDPIGHYRALVTATARLAGAHKAGRLPADVAAQFPFDREKALAADRLPDPARLRRKIGRLAQFAGDHPGLLPAELRAPDFLTRFTDEALEFQRREAAIKRFLHADPALIALCHWNANIDNAWFWRDAQGALACGLMDWGSVGQMSLAMTLWGCLSGAETAMWDAHLDDLLALFAREFAGAGGPPLDLATLERHLLLYTAMMGLAYLMDAPARIARELPNLAGIEDRLDPRFTANETARVQLLMMTNVLNLWRRRDIAAAMRAIGEAS